MPTGVPVHVLSDVDPVARTAVCRKCGPVGIRSQGAGHWVCRNGANAHKHYHQGQRVAWDHTYRRHVGDTCEHCGLQDEDTRLFDVHHLDGNHANNDPANLATLCPTCHRRAHLD